VLLQVEQPATVTQLAPQAPQALPQVQAWEMLPLDMVATLVARVLVLVLLPLLVPITPTSPTR
jgi:hypothetical protein